MNNYRLKNIELRKSKTLLNEEYWEIIYWYPNKFYNKKGEFVWDEYKQMYRHKINTSYLVTQEYIDSPESCFSLAIFEDMNNDEPNVKSVGSRPFLLGKRDYTVFHNVIGYAYEHINEMKESLNK